MERPRVPQSKPTGGPATPPVTETRIQTILFQGTVAGKNGQAFIEPVQTILAEGFPCQFNLVILSAVTGAPRGMLACTHELWAEGDLVYKHEHPPTAIAYGGTGICFRLELTDLVIGQPCVLTVKVRLSTGTVGQDVPLWVADKAALQAPQPSHQFKA
ncbi:MAG: hypothetical protein FJZ01_06990 [Candidatus Sericytochromatia bacterium]|nr:hypothetical protein [Candidatus Tanganyikabacteria bacterium]